MKALSAIFFSVFFLYFPDLMLGQSVRIYSSQFSPLASNYSVVNPAAANLASKVEASGSYLGQLGEFKLVDVFYFYAGINVSGSDKKQKNVFGITLFNEREGEFIRRPKALVSYAYHASLTEKLHLSAGAAMGFSSYNFSASEFTSGGSAIKPDGTIGLCLYSSTFLSAFSIDQIFNQRLRPKIVTLQYPVYLNFNLARKFMINPYLYLLPVMQLRWFDRRHHQLDVGLGSLVQNHFYAGISYKAGHSFAYAIGLSGLKWKEQRINAFITYHRGRSLPMAIGRESMEITLHYQFK